MNFMKIQVQIYLIVELFITIVESSLVLRQPVYLYFTDKESLFFAIVLRGARILNTIYIERSKLETTGIGKIKAMGQGFAEFTRHYPDYFRMLCYSESERFSTADNDDAREILELVSKNIELISETFKEGMEDGTVRDDLDPLEMAIYLCATRLSIMNLDSRWKTTLKARGFSYDQFVDDFRRFISPAVENRSKIDKTHTTGGYSEKGETSRQSE